MFTAAHCHPFDLKSLLPDVEEVRRTCNTACAASSWNKEQFEFHEELAQKAKTDNAPPLALCYAVHPQLPAYFLNENTGGKEAVCLDGYYSTLEELAALGRLDAVGEAGFDLFDKT